MTGDVVPQLSLPRRERGTHAEARALLVELTSARLGSEPSRSSGADRIVRVQALKYSFSILMHLEFKIIEMVQTYENEI